MKLKITSGELQWNCLKNENKSNVNEIAKFLFGFAISSMGIIKLCIICGSMVYSREMHYLFRYGKS